MSTTAGVKESLGNDQARKRTSFAAAAAAIHFATLRRTDANAAPTIR
ncbi:MAG TPA: hypothetical protein VFW15_15195 [Thermoanaerobaculia bacterium]|nr:hypothetical protein [Thermoanaerobaculia bacterium]